MEDAIVTIELFETESGSQELRLRKAFIATADAEDDDGLMRRLIG